MNVPRSNNALSVQPIETADFSAGASYEGGRVVVRLKGNADVRVMFRLEALVKVLEAEIERVGTKEVLVDLRELEFMNSSCFKCFVSWLGNVQEYPAERQYAFRFLSDPNKHWQQRSLNALSCFAASLVQIEQAA